MNNLSAEVNPGSFRDRDGRVYHYQQRIFRGLSAAALESYRQLREKRFYKKLAESGKVIGTRELEAADNPLPDELKAQWAGFLEHDPVPVISYPYEWTFSMLKAAASLQLHLVERAVSNGFSLKDATPYNIQFVNRKPVFIDIPSFEPLQEGEPWAGYRCFRCSCRPTKAVVSSHLCALASTVWMFKLQQACLASVIVSARV